MRMVIKFVLYALVVVLLVSWMTTVIRSCGDDTADSSMEQSASDSLSDLVSDEDAIVSDLLESAAAEESAGDDPVSNTPQITSIDYSKRLDKDEEAMLEELAREKEKTTPAPKSEPAPVKTESKPATPASSGSGNYFVITGSFGEKANAEKQRQKLSSLGYKSAEVVQFDGSKLFTVISGRYGTGSAADKIVSELKSKHKIDCYVKKREL